MGHHSATLSSRKPVLARRYAPIGFNSHLSPTITIEIGEERTKPEDDYLLIKASNSTSEHESRPKELRHCFVSSMP